MPTASFRIVSSAPEPTDASAAPRFVRFDAIALGVQESGVRSQKMQSILTSDFRLLTPRLKHEPSSAESDALEQADRRERRQGEAPAIGDERQRDAGDRHDAHVHTDIDQQMAHEQRGDADRDQASEDVARNASDR